MDFLTAESGSYRLTDELKQKQTITNQLLHLILYSKRLLVEHVDSLEQCMQQYHPAVTAGRQLLTMRNASILLGGTVLQHFITPRGLRLSQLPVVLLTTAFGAMCAVKSVFMCRNKNVERTLEQLLKTIEEFCNCMRRNMTYFQEIFIMKQAELTESHQIHRAWDCITVAKDVIQILYDATRKLEADYPLPPNYGPYYVPIEDLHRCQYFKSNVTSFGPPHIKAFHNIFSYVQSQYFLRLALTIMTHPSFSQLSGELEKIDKQVRQLVKEEEEHFANLTVAMQNKKQLEVEELPAAKAVQQKNGPISVLQHSSLKLSASMVAVAGECQTLDVTLQQLTATESANRNNTDQLEAVANNMRSIENSLFACCDDFQRLMLVYNKFLNSKLDLGKNSKEKLKSPTKKEDYSQSMHRVECHNDTHEPQMCDDFYAYMSDTQLAKQEQNAHQASQPTPERELLNFEKRITRRKFNPVLKQLKDRIGPIRRLMLEKEREVLAAKGINVDELFDSADEMEEEDENLLSEHTQISDDNSAHPSTSYGISASRSGSDPSDSAEEAYQERIKRIKKRDHFSESRQFLAQKTPVNLIQQAHTHGKVLTRPTSLVFDEDMLESEC